MKNWTPGKTPILNDEEAIREILSLRHASDAKFLAKFDARKVATAMIVWMVDLLIEQYGPITDSLVCKFLALGPYPSKAGRPDASNFDDFEKLVIEQFNDVMESLKAQAGLPVDIAPTEPEGT